VPCEPELPWLLSVTWLQGNTALTLIGDLPCPELIDIAASVE